jgi:2-dehydro-3-deoxyglucarate aldolase
VQGLDAIIIGPYDLSASMGLTGKFNHPEFLKALDKVITSCKKMNKAAGLHIVEPNPKELQKRIDEGYRFIAYSIDSVFLRLAVNNPV